MLPPKDFSILFLDMNSFFASVEQQVRPDLRGQPVGVAPYAGDSGCIIAASYEAKKMGVKICRVGEAKKLCPQIEIVESRPALYMIYHKEIKKVIESFSPYFRPLSIDEFVIRLTPGEQSEKAATNLALAIKKKIKSEVGDYLKCSIGISASNFLAKVAGERQKPDGLTLVSLLDLRQLYTSLALRDIPGINYCLEARLNNLYINSPLDLFNLSREEMMRKFKHWGRVWYYRLRGYEIDNIESKTKTIGHSHVLAPELRTRQGATSVIEKLIAKVGYRLRQTGFRAGGVAVSIRFSNRSGFNLSQRVASFCDNKSFHDHVFFLLKKCRWQSQPVHIAVTAFNLIRLVGSQQILFPEIEKPRRISEALDKINDHFGAGTIYPASMFSGRDSAPDRIPFGSPRYDIIH